MSFESFSTKDEGEFGNQVPSLKEISLMHIKKISGICCNEFTKGYWEEKPIKVGGGIAITKKYNPDQRAVFCNAIDFLLWVVYPFADKGFKDKYALNGKESNFVPEKGETLSDWGIKINERKEIFIQIMLMFERCNFFDSQTGKTE